MAMSEEGRMVLCGANAYVRNIILIEKFNEIPEPFKNEMHIIAYCLRKRWAVFLP